MKDISNIINKMLASKTDWYWLIPQTQLFMNLRTSSYHGFTPFSVMFNRPFVGMSDFSSTPLKSATPEEIVARYNHAQSILFPQVSSASTTANLKRKQSLDKKLKTLTVSYKIPPIKYFSKIIIIFLQHIYLS